MRINSPICSLVVATVIATAGAPAAHAQSVHAMTPGTTLEGKARFARSDVPLPPGAWTLAAAGTYSNQTIDGMQRFEVAYATLIQVSNTSLVGLVTISGSPQADTIRWPRERACDRGDLLFVDTDRNFNNADQSCVMASHTVRTWVAADTATNQIKALYGYVRDAGLTRPTTTLMARMRFVRGGEFIDVTYEALPAAFGGPTTRINNWATSEWHKDVIASHSAHRRFADDWIAWTKAMGEQVKSGFGRTVAEFRPLSIGLGAGGPSAGTVGNVVREFRAPAIGTRFVTAGGHFEIARVDGMMISTINAANQGASWQPGGLLPLGAETRFDRTVAESIFPLEVGKKVEFVQQAASGTNTWRQTLEVVRNETLTVDGRSYPTFVIEGRTEATGPAMAEFVRKRTLWFAPDAGWLLRLREEQQAGPPQRLNNWDVLRIVPPS